MTRKWNAAGRLTHAVALASLVAGSACASNPTYQHRDRTTDANGDVVNQRRDDAGRYAHREPPQDRSETPPPQPGAEFIWVSGHHSWDGADFQWHKGQWTVPPTGYHTWTVGRWEQTGTSNWVYVEGQWQ
jgi:hypothetical protein